MKHATKWLTARLAPFAGKPVTDSVSTSAAHAISARLTQFARFFVGTYRTTTILIPHGLESHWLRLHTVGTSHFCVEDEACRRGITPESSSQLPGS